jgi:ABC-type Fe3+-hydroxamate transport system substrate-binding protein
LDGQEVRSRAARLPKPPRVFFEEWDDPLISGIGWVSELVEIAGGIDIFADLRNQGVAKDRMVTAEEVVSRDPDLIIGSWCGKKFQPERVVERTGEQIKMLTEDLTSPARLCRPCRLAGPALRAATAGFSIQEGEI